MKKTKIILMALVALLCVGATAATKKQRKGKKAAKEVAERVDTVSVDTFSYLLGMANSNGLKAYLSQRMGIDTA